MTVDRDTPVTVGMLTDALRATADMVEDAAGEVNQSAKRGLRFAPAIRYAIRYAGYVPVSVLRTLADRLDGA